MFTVLLLAIIGCAHVMFFRLGYGHPSFLPFFLRDAEVLLVLLWLVAFLFYFWAISLSGARKVIRNLVLSFLFSFISGWLAAIFAFNAYGT